MNERIVIIGATSAIAQACARRLAVDGAILFIAARDVASLAEMSDDLQVRGASSVFVEPFESTDYASHKALVETAWERLKGVDVVLVAHGTLPDQDACEASFSQTREAFEVNALGVISVLGEFATKMESAGNEALIAVITSVAGDRGRGSNYVYGAAKACVDTFLAGLRHRLFKSSVRVLTIKPGFVDTPMTAAIPKGPLWAKPDRVAEDICRAIRSRRNGTIYTPWFWRPIMWVIKALPGPLFLRTKL